MAIRKGKVGSEEGGKKVNLSEEPTHKVKNEGTADGQIETPVKAPVSPKLKIAKKG